MISELPPRPTITFTDKALETTVSIRIFLDLCKVQDPVAFFQHHKHAWIAIGFLHKLRVFDPTSRSFTDDERGSRENVDHQGDGILDCWRSEVLQLEKRLVTRTESVLLGFDTRRSTSEHDMMPFESSRHSPRNTPAVSSTQMLKVKGYAPNTIGTSFEKKMKSLAE
jgi:hypothetical protein